jgi:hypothetical protein
MRVKRAALAALLLFGCPPAEPIGTITPPDAAPLPTGVQLHPVPRDASPDEADASARLAVHGMQLPVKHPRLFWTPERKKRATEWLGKHPLSPKPDDYVMQAFVYAMGGADCSRAIDWALAVDMSGAGKSVACDRCRWDGEAAILVFDWCYGDMSASQRKTFADRVGAWLAAWSKEGWGGTSRTDLTFEQNNYFWGYWRNEIEFAITTYPENRTVADELFSDALDTRWKNAFLPTTKTTSKGGVAQEGSQYGNYLLGYPVIPFQTAAAAGRDMWSESGFFREAVFYLVYTTLYAPTVSKYSQTGLSIFPFSEDEFFERGGEAQTPTFGDFMLAAAERWSTTNVGRYARQWLATVKPKLSPWQEAADPGGDARDLALLPLDYYASGPQYLWAHSSAPFASSTSVFVQMGGPTSSAHYNRDPGAFQIWRGGRWLSRQTVGYANDIAAYGAQPPVDTQDAVGHNSLLVEGRGVIGAYPGGTRSMPIVRRLESDPAFTYADVDLTPVHRTKNAGEQYDNPMVEHIEREYLFVRSLETLIVFDRIETDTASRKKTFLLHAETKPVVEDAKHVLITNGPQALRMTTLVPAAVTHHVVDENVDAAGKPIKNRGVGQFRIEVEAGGAATAARDSYILTVLQAKDAAAQPLSPTIIEQGGAFVVTLDPSTQVTFEKGKTSTGGKIRVKNGAGNGKSLRSNVQLIEVTDDGPSWR